MATEISPRAQASGGHELGGWHRPEARISAGLPEQAESPAEMDPKGFRLRHRRHKAATLGLSQGGDYRAGGSPREREAKSNRADPKRKAGLFFFFFFGPVLGFPKKV